VTERSEEMRDAMPWPDEDETRGDMGKVALPVIHRPFVVAVPVLIILAVGLALWLNNSTDRSAEATDRRVESPTGQQQVGRYAHPGKIAPDVIDALATASSVPVIVTLANRLLVPVDRAALRDSITASATRVLAAAPSAEFTVVHQYEAVPALAGKATAAGITALAEHPDVADVTLNRKVHADLAHAVPLIGADDVHSLLNVTGAGVVVAVLDTGIDTDHPLLSDDLLYQQCTLLFGGCPAGPGIAGGCPPNNVTVSPYAEDGDGHGSHVSGIITSAGPPVGVAPDAGIKAFKVLDDCGRGHFADVLFAYDTIILSHPDVDIINMSLGDGGSYSAGSCEERVPALTFAIGATRAMGMTTFAASGNNGSKAGIGYPACISDVVSVGAVYDSDVGTQDWSPACTDPTTAADQVVCFSQSDTALDLLAPGSTIESTVPGGGLATFSGTSMASPMAAAVAALLLESEPSLTPADVEARLTETGAPVADAANSVTTCRVDAYEAVINDGGPTCASSSPPPTPTPTPRTDGAMAVDCDAVPDGVQTQCTYEENDTFHVQVHVTEPPAGGYFGFQTKVSWTDATLSYLPTAGAGQDALWPRCDIALRSDGEAYVLSACIPFPPLTQGDTFTGAVLQFEFQCQEDGASPLELVHRAGDPNGGTHFLDALNLELDPLLINATIECIVPTPTPTNTPTPTKQPPPGDTDNDGCSDVEENGPSPSVGGQRDYLNFWDFFDVPTGSALQRDKAIGAGDLAALVARFGANDATPGDFDRDDDPRSMPNPEQLPSGRRENYHPAFDRGGTLSGGNPWELAAADGFIGASDLAGMVIQFGHNCSG